MIEEYTFTCVYCGTETMTNDGPYPNATWTKSYDERGWVCGHGQCREDLYCTEQREEGLQADYEAHAEEIAKFKAEDDAYYRSERMDTEDYRNGLLR